MIPAMRSVGRLSWLACVLALAGCAIGADLFNSQLLSAFGLDPASFRGPTGSVIVSFTNRHTAPVEFNGFAADDFFDITAGFRGFSQTANPGETRNSVIDCPLGGISFGTVGENFAIDNNTAATVIAVGETQGTNVAYAGQPLQLGVDFQCGDLIDVSLVPDANAEGGLRILVRVIPGR